jgi:hypothetical protein
LLVAGLLVALSSTVSLRADATVKTLGGGRLSPNGADAGFVDGDTLQLSQFNTPSGCAIDAAGKVYVADRNNGALRRLDLAANRCRTVLSGLKQPVAVSVDTNNVIYVLNQGDGTIQKLDRGVASILSTGLASPAAMAYDGQGSLFVAQSGGTVVRVQLQGGSVSGPIISGLNQPAGVAFLDSGLLAVSESGANLIRIWDPKSGTLQSQIGTGSSGFADGPASIAAFRQPQQLAKAPGGSLLIADRGNARVRLMDSTEFVSTLYGVDPSTWEGPACTTCNPVILPGWLDGPVDFAEAREPVGITVGPDGTVYTTEVFYHLVRQVTGAPLFGGDGTTSTSTNVVVLPPSISPISGYFPMGQTITVSNPNTSSLLPSAVYYTTDGTEPTTNSLQVAMNGQNGTIFWQQNQSDLTSLRVKTFLGANPSTTVSGQAVAVTEIGVPQDMAGGIGSTVIVPIVVNLRTNDQLQSLQFRVEVTPTTPGAPMISQPLQALSVKTNDFIPLYAGGQTTGAAVFQTAPYSFGQTQGAVISFIGTSANLSIRGFGAPGVLAIALPPASHAGDTYSIEVLNPSGTADGAQQQVPISAMPARSLVIASMPYLVGDAAPAVWYNSAQFDLGGALRRGFGDGLLDNSDVNLAFAASVGQRVPFPNTDLFDALDVFPEDTETSVGGDGAIRFLDWQVILLRSLGLDTARWQRTWAEGGIRVPAKVTGSGAPSSPGQTLMAAPGAVWDPQVTLSAQSVDQVEPGVPVDVPVVVQVAPGNQVAGLAFRTVVEPNGGAPVIDQPVQFIPSPDMPMPPQNSVPSPNTALCGWPLVPSSAFDPPLHGTNLLGHVRVTVPLLSRPGQSYTVRFANADGSPDLQTQYNFETRSGSIWVLSSPLEPASMTSDDWKLHFFGTLTGDAAADDADPDQDGVPNWAEYQAGTDPTSSQSYLHLDGASLDPTQHAVVLRWLSAPGKVYQIETAPALAGAQWSVVASNLVGDGNQRQWTQAVPAGNTQFYRIGIQP